MKGLIVTTCLMFVTLFALLLYTHYDTKKFIESLPQAPARQREVRGLEKASRPPEMGQSSNESVHIVDAPGEVLQNPPDTHEHGDDHDYVHEHASLSDSTSFSESDVTQRAEVSVEEPLIEEQVPPGVVPWKTVAPDGEIVFDRDAIIAEFGNTPKVHKYLALARTINTADSLHRSRVLRVCRVG